MVSIKSRNRIDPPKKHAFIDDDDDDGGELGRGLVRMRGLLLLLLLLGVFHMKS